MISENDLRIGNWVNNHLIDRAVQVMGIGHDKDGYDGYFIEYDGGTSAMSDEDWQIITGIPLSPEILEKIEGFNRETKITISKVYNDIGQVFTLNKVDGKYFLTWGDLEVKTLHQLQNIYYFFTGTELIINL